MPLLKSPLAQASGYFLIFLPPALLAAGWALGHPYLLTLFFFGVLPFSRLVFGGADHTSPDYSERLSTLLYQLPASFAVIGLGLVASMPYFLALTELSSLDLSLLAISTLVAFSLATCIAHTLIHRSSWHRALGSAISSVCAYPWLQYEHLSHHARSRSTQLASSPRRNQSALSFALHRLWLVPKVTFAFSQSPFGRQLIRNPFEHLWFHVALTLATWALFTWFAGLSGFFFYAFLVVFVPFIVSLVNYLQHWGLGDDLDEFPESFRHLAWDDDCQVLTWLTLALNFHQGHHDNHAAVFFHYKGTPEGLRLPVGYGFSVLLCLVPQVWMPMMNRELNTWLNSSRSLERPGHRLFCFSLPN